MAPKRTRQSRTSNLGDRVPHDPSRPSHLPTFYQVASHPLVEDGFAGRIFVYLQDTSAINMKKLDKLMKGRKVPLGSNEDANKAGECEIEVKPGDIIFARDQNGSGKPEHDAVEAWITGGTGPNGMARELQIRLQHVVEKLLGPKKKRTNERPTKNADTGELTGGSHFERYPDVAPVEDNVRAYTLGPTHQRMPNIIAPAASAKSGPTLDEHMEIHRDAVNIGARVAMDSLRSAPKEYAESLKIQSEAINAPRIGTDDNFAYPTMQLNNAAGEKEEDERDNSASLGKFGKKHRDGFDGAGGHTCMTSYNSMPKYYIPGRFHLLELGVYVTLNDFVCANFYGQRYHGGTPPICPRNKPLVNHAVRTSLVCYPSGAMLNGTSLYAFASLPHGHLFCIRPEMIQLLNPSYGSAKQAASCTQATFASAGHVIMSNKASHTHFARAALSIVHFFKLQSAYTNWRINSKKFLGAFEHENDDGRWISEVDWELAPCAGNDGARKDAFERWAKHVHHSESFIPSIARKGGRAAANAILSTGSSDSQDAQQKEMQAKQAKCKYCGSISWISKTQALKILNEYKLHPPKRRQVVVGRAGVQRKRIRKISTPLPAESEDGDEDSEGLQMDVDESSDEDLGSQDEHSSVDGLSSAVDQPDGLESARVTKNSTRGRRVSNDIPYKSNVHGMSKKTRNSRYTLQEEYIHASPSEDEDTSDENAVNGILSDTAPSNSDDIGTRSTNRSRHRDHGTSDEGDVDSSDASTPPNLEDRRDGKRARMEVTEAPEELRSSKRARVGIDETPDVSVAIRTQRATGAGLNFLASINGSGLESELSDLQISRAAANEFRTDDVITAYLRTPKDLGPIASDPWSTDTFNRIQDVWTALDTHNKFDRTRVVKNAQYRRSIMQSHLLAWEWLDVTARNRCLQIHRGEEIGAACWFDALVNRVGTLILTNTRRASIPATDFTSALNVEPYQWHQKEQQAGFLPEEYENFAVDKCIDILGCWLGYDTKSTGRAQSWYLRHIVEAFGTSSLYLKKVHQGYMRLKADILGNRRIINVRKEDFNPFVLQLASHPLSVHQSHERLLVEDIACVVEDRDPARVSGLHTIDDL